MIYCTVVFNGQLYVNGKLFVHSNNTTAVFELVFIEFQLKLKLLINNISVKV